MATEIIYCPICGFYWHYSYLIFRDYNETKHCRYCKIIDRKEIPSEKITGYHYTHDELKSKYLQKHSLENYIYYSNIATDEEKEQYYKDLKEAKIRHRKDHPFTSDQKDLIIQSMKEYLETCAEEWRENAACSADDKVACVLNTISDQLELIETNVEKNLDPLKGLRYIREEK